MRFAIGRAYDLATIGDALRFALIYRFCLWLGVLAMARHRLALATIGKASHCLVFDRACLWFGVLACEALPCPLLFLMESKALRIFEYAKVSRDPRRICVIT